MKTSWSFDYLNRRYGNWNLWKRDRQREFEAETGVKWTTWHAHGKIYFAPCWTRETPECTDNAVLEKVMNALPRQASAMYAVVFLNLVEKTGLSLPVVVSAAKTLCWQTEVDAVVCRMGKVIGIYRSSRRLLAAIKEEQCAK